MSAPATPFKEGDMVRYKGRKWFIDEMPAAGGSLAIIRDSWDTIVAPIELLKAVKK